MKSIDLRRGKFDLPAVCSPQRLVQRYSTRRDSLYPAVRGRLPGNKTRKLHGNPEPEEPTLQGDNRTRTRTKIRTRTRIR